MACIMVTTFTRNLIDEAEKQAKVGANHPTSHKNLLPKLTCLTGIGEHDKGTQWDSSLLRNLAVP